MSKPTSQKKRPFEPFGRYLSPGQWARHWKMPVAKAAAVIRKGVAKGKMVHMTYRAGGVEVPLFAMASETARQPELFAESAQ